jgi:hypothetical protein
VGGANAGAAVLDRLVGDGVLARVGANHLGLHARGERGAKGGERKERRGASAGFSARVCCAP